jgi:hypothetical protein
MKSFRLKESKNQVRKDLIMPDTTEFETMLREWIIEESHKPSSLSQMEQTLRHILQRVGNLLLSLWLMWLSREYRDPIVPCPMCGESASYVRQKRACSHTMFGKVRYKRALYHCESCGEWHSAMDEALGSAIPNLKYYGGGNSNSRPSIMNANKDSQLSNTI